MKIRIFKTETKKPKTFLVVNPEHMDLDGYDELVRYAKRYFKCSRKHLVYAPGFLYNGYLYPYADPDEKKSKLVGVMYYISKGWE